MARHGKTPGTYTVTYPAANKYGQLTLTVKVRDGKAQVIDATAGAHPAAVRDAVTVVRNLYA